MNKTNLNMVISDGNIVIPIYILKCFKNLNLNMEEFIFLMYLYSKQDKIEFNPERIGLDLSMDIMEVMGFISVLTDKGYISLDVLKNEKDIIGEVINLDGFYEKISTCLINSTEERKEESNILNHIEHELGRSLSACEIKTVNGWISNKIDESLIKEAFKIALNDGVYSLKYIDKILLDWSSRGISSLVDINKDLKTNNEINEKSQDFDNEIDDWDWLDDESEYIAN